MDTCKFHPEHTLGSLCGKPAYRQVFFPNGHGGGYYMYICDECLVGAVPYWASGGFEVEF